MTWTDRHGRPEIVMHPYIKRGVASHRLEALPEKATRMRKETEAEPAAAMAAKEHRQRTT